MATSKKKAAAGFGTRAASKNHSGRNHSIRPRLKAAIVCRVGGGHKVTGEKKAAQAGTGAAAKQIRIRPDDSRKLLIPLPQLSDAICNKYLTGGGVFRHDPATVKTAAGGFSSPKRVGGQPPTGGIFTSTTRLCPFNGQAVREGATPAGFLFAGLLTRTSQPPMFSNMVDWIHDLNRSLVMQVHTHGASAPAKHLIPFSVRVRKAGRIQHFLILSATSAAALSCAMSVLPDGVAFAASVIRAGGAA